MRPPGGGTKLLDEVRFSRSAGVLDAAVKSAVSWMARLQNVLYVRQCTNEMCIGPTRNDRSQPGQPLQQRAQIDRTTTTVT